MDIFGRIFRKYLLFDKEQTQSVEEVDVIVVGAVGIAAFIVDPVEEVGDELLRHLVYVYDRLLAAVVVDAKHSDITVVCLERRRLQCPVAMFAGDVGDIHFNRLIESGVGAVVVNPWRPSGREQLHEPLAKDRGAFLAFLETSKVCNFNSFALHRLSLWVVGVEIDAGFDTFTVLWSRKS